MNNLKKRVSQEGRKNIYPREYEKAKNDKDIENVGKMLLSLSLYKKDKLKFNTSISKYPERSLKQLVGNTKGKFKNSNKRMLKQVEVY